MAAPQVAGAAALILSVCAEAGANITGRSAELISILSGSVEYVYTYYSYYVGSGGRLNVGKALLGIPEDLSIFQTNPNAPIPFTLPDLVPGFSQRNDLYWRTVKPSTPGNEISTGATQVAVNAQSIINNSGRAWYADSGVLRGHTARYGCACSSCLGPEAVYMFDVPEGLAPEWLAFTVTAEPTSDIVLSIFRQGLTGDPNIISYNSAQANLTDDEYMVDGPCGGIKDATISMPIQAGGRYHVIVDGLAGYDGAYNVSFSSQPLAQEVQWEDITSSRGFSHRGNLTRDGLPMFMCFDPCPLLGCQDNNDVVFHFTAGDDAMLRIATSPYDSQTAIGTIPTIGETPSPSSPSARHICIMLHNGGVGLVLVRLHCSFGSCILHASQTCKNMQQCSLPAC